jgi:RNA polymerase sigma-70 factor (ECF subfamily)
MSSGKPDDREGSKPDDRDQKLMARIQTGDRGAFEELYARFAQPLLNFFFQMCYDRTASEDYLQETFLRVWRARQTYRPIGKVSTWLFQIAKNYWFNEREKMKRRPFHSVSGGDEALSRWSNIPDSSPDTAPEGAARAEEVEQAIAKAIEGLSDKLRVVFVMARYQRLPYAEIAAILDIPVGTVKSRVALAEKNLRARLAQYLEGTK